MQWVEMEQEERILRKHWEESHDDQGKVSYGEVVFVLDNRCLICIGGRSSSVEILFSGKPDEARLLAESIRKFRQRSTESIINALVMGRDGLSLAPLELRKQKCSVHKNYNDDLVCLHENIVHALRKKNTSGLTLFYGVPGTGKSTYIRHLISRIKKRIIFISPRLAGNMDDPQITSLLIENPNTVIIIEDAEDLLVSRDAESNSGISMLLNLTDGLLGASLGIQFICTFNTHLSNIDNALLRKGRLTTLYEFKPLSEVKSKALLSDLGIKDYTPSQPMTLAELYGVKQQEFEYGKNLNRIGFASKVA